MTTPATAKLTHLDEHGKAQMVDVSSKAISQRVAVASAMLTARAEVLDKLFSGVLPKGDALGVARIAGIQAAKRAGELIPLCHPLGLDWVGIDFDRPRSDQIRIVVTVKTAGRTGVEMEAMTGAAVAALAVYDMAKGVDKGIVIGPVQLEHKSGGKSGAYERTPGKG